MTAPAAAEPAEPASKAKKEKTRKHPKPSRGREASALETLAPAALVEAPEAGPDVEERAADELPTQKPEEQKLEEAEPGRGRDDEARGEHGNGKAKGRDREK